MSTHKRRKLSGLSSLELSLAYNSLLDLEKTLIYEDLEEGPVSEKVQLENKFGESLQWMLGLMKSRLEGPQSFPFSGISTRILSDQMKIASDGIIGLKSEGQEERLKKSMALGENAFWCSKNMYCHLATLQQLVPKMTEASARAWIDTFFFRSAAMLPAAQSMVLNMEYTVSSTTIRPSSFATMSGRIDYTAITASPKAAVNLMGSSHVSELTGYLISGFFVTEAKNGPLIQHVGQAVVEIYACAKNLGKNILRGALTNGLQWLFLIVYLKEDGEGASYVESPLITLEAQHLLDHPADGHKPDLIAGILAYWIEHSFEGIKEDDWFTSKPTL